MKTASKFFCYLIVFQMMFSCKFEEDTPNVDLNPDVQEVNGYLHIKSPEVFKKLDHYFRESDDLVVSNWLTEFSGYKSLFEFNQDIMYAETALGEKLDKMNESQLKTFFDQYQEGDQIHSSFVNKNSQYLTFGSENEFGIKYAIPENYYPFVNMDGIVKIGDNLIKFTDKYQYTILGGDESKLTGIENLTATSNELGIEVMEVGIEKIPLDIIYDPATSTAKLMNCDGPGFNYIYPGTGALLGCGKNGAFRVRGLLIASHIGAGECDGTGKNKKQLGLRVNNQKYFGTTPFGIWLDNGTTQLSFTVRSFGITSSDYPDGHYTPFWSGLEWLGIPTPLPTPITRATSTFKSNMSSVIWETDCNYTDFGVDFSNTILGIGATFRAQNFTVFNTTFAPCDC